MSQDTVTPGTGACDSAFGAFAAVVVGLALLETGLVLLQAKPGAHLFSMLVGGAFIALTLRRFLQCWPPRAQAASDVNHRHPRRIAGTARATSCALVGGAGYVAAGTLSSGYVTPFMLFAAGLVFMPWTRIAQTRTECLVHGAVGALGLGAGLLTSYPRLNPVLLPAVAWLLWMSATAGWVRIVLDEKRKQRLAPPKTGADGSPRTTEDFFI